MVNRLWKHHFESGIVKSTGNFGHTGTLPTHPKLLDWLAREFIRSGWSMKAFHRLIMTSNTYRQSSALTPACERLDPGNDLISRFPLKRMEAEVLSDTILQVSGRLDETNHEGTEITLMRSARFRIMLSDWGASTKTRVAPI